MKKSGRRGGVGGLFVVAGGDAGDDEIGRGGYWRSKALSVSLPGRLLAAMRMERQVGTEALGT